MHALSALLLTKLVLWHAYAGGEEKALTQVVRSFHEAHPQGPQIEAISVPYGSFADKLQAAIPRGHGPDLFIQAHDIVGQWSRLGLIEPLDAHLPLPEVLPMLWPETIEPLRDGQTLLGLPLSWKSLALFYRKDLVPQPPQTTDEIAAIGERLRLSSAGAARRYGLVYEAGNFFKHAALLHGFGGSIIPSGSPVPTLDTPEQLRALTFVSQLVKQGSLPDEMSAVLVTQFFNEGRAAMTINGPWFIAEIAPDVPYGVAPMPVVSATGKVAAPLTSIEAGFVSARSLHKQEAADFLRHLAGPASARVRALVGRQSVTEKSTWELPEVQRDPVLSAFFAQRAHLVPSPTHPAMRAFWEPGEQALRQVLRGAEPQPALHGAQRLLDQYLKPAPKTAKETPYLIALSIAVLALVGWQFVRLRKRDVFAEAWRERSAYGYVVPALLAMTLLTLVPFLVGAAMSLFHRDLDGSWRFIGGQNFRDILLCVDGGCFEPMSFYFTLVVTMLWTAVNVVLHLAIGGGLALILRSPWLKLRGVYRMLLIVPWAVPNYITGLIWKGMFNRQFGAINGLLSLVGIPPVSWFSHFTTALAANIATNVWLGFPFMMVVALGHLAQIPSELEEAAMLDGASRWQRLRHVILPLLLPAMLPSVILGAVWTFNMFNVVFLVSGGEPDGATDILVSQAYRWAFTRGHRYGFAAAYAVLIFLILIIQSALTRRLTDRR